jgi:hypothetical protein
MPKATVEQGSAYFLPEGEFVAILRSVEDRITKFTYKSHHKAVQSGRQNAGDEGQIHRWKWTFELLSGEKTGSDVVLETDPSIELEGFSPARMAYEALQGEPLELGQDIDTDLVVGMKARLVLKHMPPREAGDRVFYDTKVTDVLPAKDGDESAASPWDGDEPPF